MALGVQESAGFVRIYADVTRPPEGTFKEFAARFQAINPPVVVLIGPDGQVLKAWRSPPPVVDFLAALRGS